MLGVPTATISTNNVPIPIAYEFAAVARLGPAILVASGVDPAQVEFADASFDAGHDWLDDQPVIGLDPLLRADDRALAAPVSLGVDDWTLVWGARVPAETVDRLSTLLVGDSFQPFLREGAVCFAGVFQTGNETAGGSLFTAMQLWATGSAVGAQAVASQIDLNTVQIEACDPGAGTPTIPDPATIDSLITRQIARLAG